jgi:hypothetical protein
LVALGAAGCGGGASGATGVVEVTLGGDGIAEMIPPHTGSTEGFEGGWTLRYTKFLINIGAVTVGASNGAPGGMLSGYRVYDLHAAAMPVSLGMMPGLAAQRYDNVSYRIAPANAASTAGNVSDDDLSAMEVHGYSVYVEAEAMNPARGTYHLHWGFTNDTRLDTCHDPMDQAGVLVTAGSTASAELTIHGDVPFYDNLDAGLALTRFDAIADADGNSDGEVTLEELAAVDLSHLPMGQYGAGGTPNLHTLRDFVTALVPELGHFDGEGRCSQHPQ